MAYEDEEAEDPSSYDGLDDDNDITYTESLPKDKKEEDEVKDIEELKASEKQILERQRNKASFLSRTNILIATFTGLILLIIITTLIIPSIKTKKKKTQKTQSRGDVFVPGEVESWHPVTNPYDPFSGKNDANEEKKYEDFSEFEMELNSAVEKNSAQFTDTQHNSPPARYSATPQGVTREPTNRNEQQKAVDRMPISDIQNTGGVSGYSQGGIQGNIYSTGSMPSGLPNYESLVSSISSAYSMGGNSYERQNGQKDKQSFAGNGLGDVSYKWNGDYSLDYGTIIPATLITGINTDLPGVVVARVTGNVWSSNGAHLLLPAGTRIFASYNSSVTYGQKRVQIAWNKMIRPDGLEIDLGNFTGVDANGFAGTNATEKYHIWEYAKALGLVGAFSVLNTSVGQFVDSDKESFQKNAVNDVYAEASKISGKIVDRALDIQPTLTVPQGTKLYVITNISMEIPPFTQNTPVQRYVREW